MGRLQVTEIFHELVSNIVSERRESPVLTAEWVAQQALRVINGNKDRQRAALLEGAHAIARDVLLSSNPARHRVSREAEFQYISLEWLTNGELIDLVTQVRMESVACAEALFDLQRRMSERTLERVLQ